MGKTCIYKNYAIGKSGTWATDGIKEASTNGFSSSVRWLQDNCGLKNEGTAELYKQKEAV